MHHRGAGRPGRLPRWRAPVGARGGMTAGRGAPTREAERAKQSGAPVSERGHHRPPARGGAKGVFFWVPTASLLPLLKMSKDQTWWGAAVRVGTRRDWGGGGGRSAADRSDGVGVVPPPSPRPLHPSPPVYTGPPTPPCRPGVRPAWEAAHHRHSPLTGGVGGRAVRQGGAHASSATHRGTGGKGLGGGSVGRTNRLLWRHVAGARPEGVRGTRGRGGSGKNRRAPPGATRRGERDGPRRTASHPVWTVRPPAQCLQGQQTRRRTGSAAPPQPRPPPHRPRNPCGTKSGGVLPADVAQCRCHPHPLRAGTFALLALLPPPRFRAFPIRVDAHPLHPPAPATRPAPAGSAERDGRLGASGGGGGRGRRPRHRRRRDARVEGGAQRGRQSMVCLQRGDARGGEGFGGGASLSCRPLREATRVGLGCSLVGARAEVGRLGSSRGAPRRGGDRCRLLGVSLKSAT